MFWELVSQLAATLAFCLLLASPVIDVIIKGL